MSPNKQSKKTRKYMKNYDQKQLQRGMKQMMDTYEGIVLDSDILQKMFKLFGVVDKMYSRLYASVMMFLFMETVDWNDERILIKVEKDEFTKELVGMRQTYILNLKEEYKEEANKIWDSVMKNIDTLTFKKVSYTEDGATTEEVITTSKIAEAIDNVKDEVKEVVNA
jgi:hypothetical protein